MTYPKPEVGTDISNFIKSVHVLCFTLVSVASLDIPRSRKALTSASDTAPRECLPSMKPKGTGPLYLNCFTLVSVASLSDLPIHIYHEFRHDHILSCPTTVLQVPHNFAESRPRPMGHFPNNYSKFELAHTSYSPYRHNRIDFATISLHATPQYPSRTEM